MTYKVVINLVPQTITLSEAQSVLARIWPRREGIVASADDAAALAGRIGNERSIVRVWNRHEWPDNLADWMRVNYGVPNIEYADIHPPIPESRDDMPLVVDVSKWQDKNKDGLPNDIDFFKLRYEAGVQGVIVRKSDRVSNDPMYYDWLHSVQQAGLPHGNYHRLSSYSSGVNQCRVFLDELYPGPLGDWLDVEAFGDDVPTAQHVLDFEATYRKLTGREIGIYTNFSTWKYYIKLNNPMRRLWIANYEAKPGQLKRPAVPPPWNIDDWGNDNTWVKYWQPGAYKLPGSPYAIDCNVFHGSLGEFRAMVGDAGMGG